MAVCRFSQEQPKKTLSAEIRRHRDCDSRLVADSAPEVLSCRTYLVLACTLVVYKAHICQHSSIGRALPGQHVLGSRPSVGFIRWLVFFCDT